jgi:hypothetical protein
MARNQNSNTCQIVNLTQAITPEGQFVRLRPHAVLATAKFHCKPIFFLCNSSDAHIESKLARVRVIWCAVRYDHLRERETVEQRAQDTVVVVSDRRERDALTMAESYALAYYEP